MESRLSNQQSLQSLITLVRHLWGDVPYPASRLVYTLLFMAVVVVGAVIAVRKATQNKLLADISSTLGAFLLVIGTMVYTAAFRGLRFWEMVLAWTIAAAIITWFFRRMHEIVTAESTAKSGKAISETETRFQQMIENAVDVLSIVNFDGTRRYLSPAIYRVLGYHPPELETADALDIIMPEERSKAQEMFDYIRVANGNTRSGEFRYRHKEGGSRTLQVTAKNLGDVAGIEGIVVSLRDITVQRALELQVQQSHKIETVGQLAGGIAHDFNNLLTAITGRTEFLAEATNLDADQREDVDEIRRATDRASALTRQLLAFSRKQLLVPRVLNLNQVIGDTLPMLTTLIGEDITIKTEGAADLGNITADSGQLEQVLLNLAVNARDAMPGGGVLTIRTENMSGDSLAEVPDLDGVDYVALTVADTGQGMDAHTREHLFEPFFTTKPTGKGTGLGLSTVYGILKQSGASIFVESEPGKGTSFKIYFPRTYAPVTPRADHDKAVPCKGGSETILLVEDDQAVGELAARTLKSRGYHVEVATDGGSALRIFNADRSGIDLVVTDLVMPGMTGRELMERLHLIRPALRVLYMSGYTSDEILRRGLQDSSVWFLQKPFKPDDLAAKVRQVLDHAERDPVLMRA